jgi:hypothetical protein
MRNPSVVRRIGANARRTAQKVFNYDRYLSDWMRLVDKVVGSAARS